MGQTLTHGIYLPDEGERNCYNGLAGNWQLLDGAVGTVAEHTSQIAGKAPAVHTHTKADITDFPAYGTTAGTICEGNDSRLSDARTPVAHTHTKADITDLLNSNFIPSANNSYDLGSSSYQWNNLYAKNYYYNGVAWGLDKANTWSAGNTYTSNIALKQTNLEKGELPASAQTRRFIFTDKNNTHLGWIQHRVNTSGDSYLEFYVVNTFSDGQLSTQGSEIANNIVLGLHSDGSRYLTVLGDVSPDLPGRVCNLGTSTNKWKTLNGVNPGALSLPDNSGYTNISGNITDLTGSVNSYTPPSNGYVMVNVNPNSNNYAFVSLERVTVRSSSETTSGKNAMATIPVIGGKSIDISVIGASIAQARFTPCLGNV